MLRSLQRYTLLVLAIACWVAAAPLDAAEPRAVRNAAEFSRLESPTCGIQEAIDSLPSEGGVVELPPGKYVLRRSVALRSHVTLRGAGSSAILTRGKQAHAPLTRDARKGDRFLEVDATAGFRVGDEIALLDASMQGWYMAHSVIKSIAPRRLELVEPVFSRHAEGAFRLDRKAVVVNYFAMIRGGGSYWSYDGTPVVDVAVLDLTLDGNLDENPGPWTDFTLSAIHFAGVSDSLIRNCTIRSSVGDGIGVQGGRDNRVESCFIQRCRGHGMHPGTSLKGAVFTGNVSRDNGGDGLYFCCLVVDIVVTNNLLLGNRGSGVGGLGQGCGGCDQFNVVANNVCRDNGRWGIESVQGKNNVITGNSCFDNSRQAAGRFSGIIVSDSTHTVVSGNRCGSSLEKPTQKLGIEECGRSDHNVISGNVCTDNAEGDLRIVGANTQAAGNVGRTVRQ